MTSESETHSLHVLQEFLHQLEKQNDQSLIQYLRLSTTLALERWVWDLFEGNSTEWIHQTQTLTFIQRLAKFNKRMIFSSETIDAELRAELLLPKSVEQIDQIFENLQKCSDENSTYFSLIGLWLENLSFFLHEYPPWNKSTLIIRINEILTEKFVLTKQFLTYLDELNSPTAPSAPLTNKLLFYIKSSSLSLNVYFYSNPENFSRTTEEVVEFLRTKFLSVVITQSATIETWNNEFLACLANLIGFLRSLIWWEGEKGTKLKILFSDESNLFDFVRASVRILDYQPFYQYLVNQWSNDHTILIDSTLLFLMNIVLTQNINWFCQTIEHFSDILLKLASLPVYNRIYLCAYGILTETLTDENLKTLAITDTMRTFFFNVLVQAWQNPKRKFKQIPIDYLLKGFLQLSKSDFIQQQTAKSNRLPLIIDIANEYPIAYDIIWALSFNAEVKDQLRSNVSFINQLTELAEKTTDESMKKIFSGILWNLQLNHEDRSSQFRCKEKDTFDIMISYSHKDKELCHRLYNELIKRGFRVWIDFDQMHGNVMDAMAQAIEQSQMVIICMSEDYRRSNYCRAEAQYAFQRQLKMVPVLLQKHYKPEGWLLFLIGQLLYVDFTKHEFEKAMGMLLKELHPHTVVPCSSDTKQVAEKVITTTFLPSATAKSNLIDWSKQQVQEWLSTNQLVQMSRLLNNCDGRSLLYLHRYLRQSDKQDMVTLLNEDAKRLLNERLSLVELSRFQSLIDGERQSSTS